MSDIDPLIKREIQWMSLGPLENVDLAPVIIARVRRQRIMRALTAVVGVVVIGFASIGIYELFRPGTSVQSSGGAIDTGSNAVTRPEIVGLISDYPIEWEPSVGDLGAISGAGGLGDTLGGLTAVGLKISWERCGKGQCPVTWVLSLQNNTHDLNSKAPSIDTPLHGFLPFKHIDHLHPDAAIAIAASKAGEKITKELIIKPNKNV